MIYTTPRLESLLSAIEQTQFRVKRMRFVHGNQDKSEQASITELKIWWKTRHDGGTTFVYLRSGWFLFK